MNRVFQLPTREDLTLFSYEACSHIGGGRLFSDMGGAFLPASGVSYPCFGFVVFLSDKLFASVNRAAFNNDQSFLWVSRAARVAAFVAGSILAQDIFSYFGMQMSLGQSLVLHAASKFLPLAIVVIAALAVSMIREVFSRIALSHES